MPFPCLSSMVLNTGVTPLPSPLPAPALCGLALLLGWHRGSLGMERDLIPVWVCRRSPCGMLGAAGTVLTAPTGGERVQTPPVKRHIPS